MHGTQLLAPSSQLSQLPSGISGFRVPNGCLASEVAALPRKITITTPENVRIEYELAGIASRAGAAVVDMLLQGLIVAIAVLTRYVLDRYGKWPGAGWVNAALAIGVFAINYGYFVYFETAWNGQTPGKRYAKMRAVRDGGLPIDLSCAVLRNLVRIVDFFPLFYILGGTVMLASSRNKRLGDYAAGTLVVKERTESSAPSRAERVVDASQLEPGRVASIELITPEEFAAVARFLDRQAELEDEVRERLAARIAAPLVARLGIEDDGTSSAAILSEIHRRCVEERGMR